MNHTTPILTEHFYENPFFWIFIFCILLSIFMLVISLLCIGFCRKTCDKCSKSNTYKNNYEWI